MESLFKVTVKGRKFGDCTEKRDPDEIDGLLNGYKVSLCLLFNRF